MLINMTSGLLDEAEFLLSPNHDQRPDPTDISLLVIHGISLPPGQFGSSDVIDFFMNRLEIQKHPYFELLAGVAVSTHFFIRRTGEIWQFVPLHHRAWHAGKSVFEGREACNDYSIGVELEGTDDLPYEDQQYNTLLNLTRTLVQFYPLITFPRIVGHSDIAPGRKTDPGHHFNWGKYKSGLTF